MNRVLSIDPGTTQSAWAVFERGQPVNFGICDNLTMLELVAVRGLLHATGREPLTVVIEKVASYGMAVGEEVFETVRWAGRFEQAAQPATVVRIPRLAVKLALCHDSRAKDANIRRAVIDRFGGDAATRKGGVLHGASKDVWAAIAVGLTYQDSREEDAA
jgi:hypothetical protein